MLSRNTAAAQMALWPRMGLNLALALLAVPALAHAAEDPGASAYATACAACHGATLGGGFGPPLAGPAFQAKWAAAPAALQDRIRMTMPPAKPNSLDAGTVAAIAGFLSPTASGTGAPPRPVAANVPSAGLGAGHGEPNTDAYYRAHEARLTALAGRMAPVTDALLQAPRDGDWLTWRRTRAALGFSPLQQIDKTNVKRLTVAWSLALGTGTNAIEPLVHDGVMFLNNNGVAMALDAASGDVIWRHARISPTIRVPLSQPRSIALYGQAVYVPTIDDHVLALDARSGDLIWDHEMVPISDRLETTAAPLVAHGKVIQGISGCQAADFPGGCLIVAMDAATGQEAWRFHTIARPGQAGGDSWNGAPVEQRFGGSVWTAGSYDPDLNLVYFGTGQTYHPTTLLAPTRRPGAASDALYTDTTIALNPDTGQLVWHYQHFPGDVWDLDWSFEQSLVTLRTPSGPQKAIVTSGKLGILDAVDAKTGRYLWSRDLGVQNLVTAIDPKTGAKTFDPGLVPAVGEMKLVCPGALGGRNWPASAVDPVHGVLFMPLVEACMEIGLQPTGAFRMTHRTPPDNDGKFGRVTAVDLNSRAILWTNRRRAPQSSAILATGGGLVFEGARDRSFRALDAGTGKTLWATRLDETPNAFPITFMAGGTQYVAVITGGGTPHDTTFRNFTPEIAGSTGNKTLWVFALDDRADAGGD